ncbi:hypothetical protein YC2023_075149 [Brassica napus]
MTWRNAAILLDEFPVRRGPPERDLYLAFKENKKTKDELFKDSCKKPTAMVESENSGEESSKGKTTLTAAPAKKRHTGCSFCILDTDNSPIPDFSQNEDVIGLITM